MKVTERQIENFHRVLDICIAADGRPLDEIANDIGYEKPEYFTRIVQDRSTMPTGTTLMSMAWLFFGTGSRSLFFSPAKSPEILSIIESRHNAPLPSVALDQGRATVPDQNSSPTIRPEWFRVYKRPGLFARIVQWAVSFRLQFFMGVLLACAITMIGCQAIDNDYQAVETIQYTDGSTLTTTTTIRTKSAAFWRDSIIRFKSLEAESKTSTIPDELLNTAQTAGKLIK